MFEIGKRILCRGLSPQLAVVLAVVEVVVAVKTVCDMLDEDETAGDE